METLRALSLAAVSTKAQTDGVSLDTQLADNQRVAEQNGWQITDTLVIAGHSRRYGSLEDAAAAMRAKKIDAFDRLIQHIAAHDFDILLCRDGNRFARKQSLFAQIVERIVEGGARIYTMLDGMVDTRNYTMFIAMSGYRAAQEINENVKKQGEGRRARVADDLPEHRVPDYMIPVRDERTGRSIDYRYDERYAPIWAALKTELLAGTGWLEMEYVLSREPYHLVNPQTGRPFATCQLRNMVYSPLFWGHLSSGHTKVQDDGPRTPDKNNWIFDDAVPPPEGVTVKHNRWPGIYTGRDRAVVIAELRRRQSLFGHASPQNSHMFSGLFVCAVCGYNAKLHISHDAGKARRRILCTCRQPNATRPVCSNRASINYNRARVYIHGFLEELIASSPEAVFGVHLAAEPDGMAALHKEKTALERQMNNIILAQRDMAEDTPAAVRQAYSKQMRDISARIKLNDGQIRERETRQALQRAAFEAQQMAVDDIRGIGMENFWKLPEREIHQHLHRAFGRWRLEFLNGEIVSLKYR